MVVDFVIQDSLRLKKVAGQDSLIKLSDSLAEKIAVKKETFLPERAVSHPKEIKTNDSDTASFCVRCSIADVTFHDSVNVITRMDMDILPNFPFVLTENNRKFGEETKAALVKNLKSGDELGTLPFHHDWVLPVILSSILIYAVIRAGSGKLFSRLLKFFSFRSGKESSSRDTTSLFHWQSSVFNLASFINIGLFAFFVSEHYGLFLLSKKLFIFWLAFFVAVISVFMLRIIVCLATGSISSQREIFREYIIEVYQAYRLAGLALLLINVLVVYTSILHVDILFYSGFSLIALLYFIRVFKLFLIFINRHIPIFYLILYLCALEILPVVIIVRYITGLV
jgi:hypothetical protein